MALTDRPLSELVHVVADIDGPQDFDGFWGHVLGRSREASVGAVRRMIDSTATQFHVEDVRFSGYGGEPIAAWFIRPRDAAGPLPLVVEFNGYGGGRGLPHEWLKWPAAGYASVIMDTRGQGAWWGSGGVTPDPHGHGPSAPGYATRGITDRDGYFYTRLYADAALLVETLMTWPEIDAARVAVTGTSQGGGMAIAAAALVPSVAVAMPDVPFGCWWRWSVDHTDEDPYAEVRRFLAVHPEFVDRVFATLDSVDAVNFARRARAAALFSVGLMDPVCLPTTVFAAHNAWAGPRSIEVYPHSGHEGGGGRHFLRQVEFLRNTMP
jgi:cephalosporin-C deacetylase